MIFNLCPCGKKPDVYYKTNGHTAGVRCFAECADCDNSTWVEGVSLVKLINEWNDLLKEEKLTKME